MTDEEQTPQIHHMQAKAARNALARKEISQESYAAVLAGELSLEEAKSYGREAMQDSPPKPQSKMSKDDTSSPCLCGCNQMVPKMFAPGHDMRIVSMSKEHVRGQRQLSPDQLSYAETSGKLDRARERVLEEDRKAAHRENKQREKAAKRSE